MADRETEAVALRDEKLREALAERDEARDERDKLIAAFNRVAAAVGPVSGWLADRPEDIVAGRITELRAEVAAWQDRMEAVTGSRSADAAGNAVLSLRGEVERLTPDAEAYQHVLFTMREAGYRDQSPEWLVSEVERLKAEVERLTAERDSAFERGLNAVMHMRCVKHFRVPRYNANETGGDECAACAVQEATAAAEARVKVLEDALHKLEFEVQMLPIYVVPNELQVAAARARAALAAK